MPLAFARSGFSSRLRTSAVAFVVSLASTAVGCSSPTRGSLSTSLTNLSFEARHFDGAVLAHTEVVSIGGQLAMPDVGMIYHYVPHPALGWKLTRFLVSGKWPDKDLPPSAIMLISRDHSFRLVGESRPAEEESPLDLQTRVIAVRDALIALRDASAEGTRVSSRAALLKTELKELRQKEKQSEEADEQVEEELESAIARLQERTDDIDKQVKEVQTALTRHLSKPGILIARWHRKGEQRTSLTLEPVGHARSSSEREDSGLAILGGLRVSALAIGDDFKQMVAQLDKSDSKAFSFGAINTYALQARFVSFVSDRVLTEEYDLGLRITRDLIESKDPLDMLQALEIASYSKTFQDLGNRGDIGPMHWTKKPYCFVAGTDLNQLEPIDSKQPDNWITVVAQLTHPALLKHARSDYVDQHERKALPPHQCQSKRAPCSFGRCDRYPELETIEHARFAASWPTEPLAPPPAP